MKKNTDRQKDTATNNTVATKTDKQGNNRDEN